MVHTKMSTLRCLLKYIIFRFRLLRLVAAELHLKHVSPISPFMLRVFYSPQLRL